MTRIRALQAEAREEFSGVQILAHFRWLRIQPLHARVSQMWSYSGLKDKSRISNKEWPEGAF
jgi:hypothetical protein